MTVASESGALMSATTRQLISTWRRTSRRGKGVAILIAAFALPPGARAQELRGTAFRDGLAGPVWTEGVTVSKRGVRVPFALRQDPLSGRALGYLFDADAMLTVTAGDKISIFIKRIQDGGRKDVPGAWKTVTVVSTKASAQGLAIDIKEKVKLQGGRSVQRLDLVRSGRYLTDETT